MRGTHPERAVEAHVAALRIAPRGATVVVGLSGGPDSVALASLLSRMAIAHDWHVVLVHVNHGVRESAWQDECVALSVAARLHVAIRIVALAATDRDDEASLREARYAALLAEARAAGATTIVTAHTAQDQSETVLLALFRGTGLAGLAGMPVRRELADGVMLVRPLLRIGRTALHAELRASGLPYAIDPSNASGRYKRTAVRGALDVLREEFPRLDEAVARCASIVAEERTDPERALRRRRLREQLETDVGLRDISFERIEAALSAETGRVFLRRGVELSMEEHDR